MLKRGDKKAQGLSTNAIILIVLGVVVLAVLAIGFTMGWKNLVPWLSSDNTDTILQACKTACLTEKVDGFCNVERELKGSSLPEGKYTCEKLVGTGIGLEKCSSITCPKPEEDKTYSWVVSLDQCSATGQKVVVNSYCSSVPKGDGTICCEQA